MMYELKDSYFAILDTHILVIGGTAIIFAVAGFFLFKFLKKNHN